MRLSVLAVVLSAVSIIASPVPSSKQFTIADALTSVESLNTVLLSHQKTIQTALASINATSPQVDKAAVTQKVNAESSAMVGALSTTYRSLISKTNGMVPKEASKPQLTSLSVALKQTSAIVADTPSIKAADVDPITNLYREILFLLLLLFDPSKVIVF